MLFETLTTGLFGLTLDDIVKNAGASAIQWGTKKFLDTIVGCPKCENTFRRRNLPNRTDNMFVCRACGCSAKGQHTNATRNTVRRDNTIVAAQAVNLRWEPKLSLFRTKTLGYRPVLDIRTANSRDNDLLVNLRLMPRDRRRQWLSHDIVLSPSSNGAVFRSVTTRAPIAVSDLPKPAESLILEIDLRNVHGDKLQNTVSRLLVGEGDQWLLGGRR
jgi:hypothetical protein